MKNREHLQVLRANTCYPSFRAFIGFFIVLGYLIALIEALAGIAGIFRENVFLIGGGFVGCALTIFMTKVGSEMLFMVSDIADSNIYSASEKGIK